MNNTSETFRFDNVWLLFIGLALVLVCVGGYFIIPKQKRLRPKNLISLGIHVAMSILLGFAFADPQFKISDTTTEAYVVVDVSDSEANVKKENGQTSYDTTGLTATIQNIIDQAKKQNNVQVGVVAFGKEAKVIVPLGGNFTSDTLKNVYNDASFDRSSTNIENALTYTDSLYSSTAVRKLILVSDGEQTDGSAINAIDKLITDGVMIDAVNYNAAQGDEVAITGVEYTDSCFVGRTENAKVSVRASTQMTGVTVSLTYNGLEVKKENLGLGRGLNIVNFTLDTSKEGSIDYTVKVTGTSDSFADNNTYQFTQKCSTARKTFFLGKNDDEYNNFLAVTGYAQDSVEKHLAGEDIPSSLDEMIKYDQFVISDVDLLNSTNGAYAEFIPNLDKLVNYYGKSLMTFGATFSGLGASELSDAKTYIAEYNNMLPIQFESDSSKAVCLLIDNSGSMESDNRMRTAKQGAIACLDLLTEKDYISIVTFSDNAKIVQALTSIKNKTKVTTAIRKIQSEGGTDIIPGLKAAAMQLNGSNAESKTIIVLSDGDPFEPSQQIMRQVRSIVAQNISISTINISNNSKDAVSLLRNMSNVGNGSYYYCRTSASLIATMKTSIAEDISNDEAETKDWTILVNKDDDPVLNNVDTSALPAIQSFNICRVRKVATTVLTMNYVSSSTSSEGEPINKQTTVPLLAYWKYGKGTVTSFTSSLLGSGKTNTDDDWTSALRESADGKQLFVNMANENLPDRKSDNVLDLSYVNNGTTTTLNVMADTTDTKATVTAVLHDAQGNTSDPVTLYYNGTYFTGDVFTGVAGARYTVDLTYNPSEEGGETATNNGVVIYFDYSKEYDFFSDSDNTLLSDLITSANDSSSAASGDNLHHYFLNGAYNWETNSEQIAHQSWYSSMIWFILASVILFLIDIFIRKSDFKKKGGDIKKSASVSGPTAKRF